MRLMEYAGVPGMEKHLMTAVVREEESDSGKPRKAPHVVIVGAGFGGLQAAKALQQAPVQVTVIDRNNYHLFQPLLYQVATADLSPADISAPIRSILKHQNNTSVILAEVTGVDVQGQRVLMHERSVPYDYLIVATGAHHSYFGHDAWEPFAPGLKSIDDVAPVAMQEGCYVAQVIAQRVSGKKNIPPFRYHSRRNLATVGRSFAVVESGPLHLAGFLAWTMWLAVHIFYLIGFRNRLLVMFQWAWEYLTRQRSARLITCGDATEPSVW